MSESVRPAATEWSDDEVMLRDMVKRFAAKEVAPLVSKMDKEGKMDGSMLKQLFEAGFMGVEVEDKYGGGEMSFTQTCIVVEELSKVDASVSLVVDIHNTLNNRVVERWGTDSQKSKWLSQMATTSLSSFCLSEASSGSDAFALKTTAKQQGDHYVLNGSKMWISNAAEADVFILFATVDESLRHKGITAFILDAKQPGVHVGKKEDKLGIRASSTCEVRFDDVKVAKDAVLGSPGEGYRIAIQALNEGRIGAEAGMFLSMRDSQLLCSSFFSFSDQASDSLCLHGEQFGKPISEFQGLQFQVAEVCAELEAAKVLVYNAARLKDSGAPFVKEAAIAKLISSKTSEKVASKCVEWMGGVGFTTDYAVEKYFRDSKIGQIYEGTTNIHLQTIWKLIEKEYA
ncbi:hypothetical protein NDN08_000611 [Rhodosorus marinus]|uniref:short-chain 2-methylacyl-CoA dehydrogenase n=1 Tax=Rhodosorus marinus TaxID=101924 RepID=A0AAV8US40_9RHOD|nr:hypothetical protein NDN08_000611 [Rhodosorus marinus]